MKVSVIMFLAILFISVPVAANEILNIDKHCESGLSQLGKSKFSVLKSCEDALGNYLSVVLTGNWSSSDLPVWKIGSRFWYEPSWGDDVISYFFDEKNGNLYVSTSGYYGAAGVYRLNVVTKTSEKFKIGPEDTGEGIFIIESVSDSSMHVRYESDETNLNMTVSIK